jgi:hypothetical protein
VREEQVAPAPSAGTTRNACSILVRNASPTSAPASASQRTGCRTDSMARSVAYAEPTSSSVSKRVRVVEPEHQHRDRCGRQHRTGDQAGGRRARRTPDRGVQQPDRSDALQRLGDQQAPRREPKSRIDSAIGHSASGVLSTVIELAASEEPKKNAFHDSEPGLGGGRVEAVRPAGLAETPQVQHSGADQQPDQRRPLPAGAARRERGLGRGSAGEVRDRSAVRRLMPPRSAGLAQRCGPGRVGPVCG